MTIDELQEVYGVTAKEAMILSVLLDGQPHEKDDLQHNALKVQFGCPQLVPMHIYRMRPKLRKLGIEIVGLGSGRSFLGWKLVRNLGGAS